MKIINFINIFIFLLFPILGIVLYTITPIQKYSPSAKLSIHTNFAQILVNNESIIINVYDENNENLLNNFDYNFWEKSNVKITLINNNRLIYSSKNETMYFTYEIYFDIENIHIISISNNWILQSDNYIVDRHKFYSLFNFYLIYFFIYIILFCIYYNYNIILFRDLTLGYSFFICLNQNIIFPLRFIEKYTTYFNDYNYLNILKSENVTIFLLLIYFLFFIICVALVFKKSKYISGDIENIIVFLSFTFFSMPLFGTIISWRKFYNTDIINNFMKLLPICLIYMYYMIAKKLLKLNSIELYSIILINFMLNIIINIFGISENNILIILTIIITKVIYFTNLFNIYSNIEKLVLFIHKCLKQILSKNTQIRDIEINVIRTILFTGFSLLSII